MHRGRVATMVVTVALAMAAVAGCRGPGAAAAPEAERETSVVTTQGTAVIRTAANQAFVTVTVESVAVSPRESRTRNARVMAEIRKRLQGAGLAEDAVRTLAYYLDEEHDYVKGKPVSRGYVTRNTIEVRLEEIDRVGEVIDVAVGAGATAIGPPRFELRERAAVEREALRRAVASARARAEAAALGAGMTVDRVLQIEESVAVPRAVRRAFGRARSPVLDEPPQTSVAPGEIEIQVRVTLTAALK
ncbi:MAG TPA: SIMPL domain-containing protein [Candidatus Binatia bacterium]|nr:SIMPL domain-containing protein [Candidatus Binatia bacterium]